MSGGLMGHKRRLQVSGLGTASMALGLAFVAAGCSWGPDPSPVTPTDLASPSSLEPKLFHAVVGDADNYPETPTVSVVDYTGMVTAAARVDPEAARAADVAVFNPAGDVRQLAFSWAASPCETRARLTLTAEADQIKAVLIRDVRPPVECDLIAIGRGVTLDLASDIRADRVSLTIVQSPDETPAP